MSKLVFDEEKAQRLTEALGRAEKALSDIDQVVREVAVEREVQRSQEDGESDE